MIKVKQTKKGLFKQCDCCKEWVHIWCKEKDEFSKWAMRTLPQFNAFDTGKHNWDRWLCMDCIYEVIEPNCVWHRPRK